MAKQGASFCLIYSRISGRFLFEHRGTEVKSPNTYGLFGGGLDAGETPEQGLSRELREEIGRKFKHFDYGFCLSESKNVYLFVKMVLDEFEPNLSWESQGYRWVRDIEDVKPLHKKILRYYGTIRRMMAATRKASAEAPAKRKIDVTIFKELK